MASQAPWRPLCSPSAPQGNGILVASLTSDPQTGQAGKTLHEFIPHSLRRPSPALADHNFSSPLSCRWTVTVLELNTCMVIVSINVTDIYSTGPAAELSTAQMSTYLIRMSTLDGRCYCHTHFTGDKRG